MVVLAQGRFLMSEIPKTLSRARGLGLPLVRLERVLLTPPPLTQRPCLMSEVALYRFSIS